MAEDIHCNAIVGSSTSSSLLSSMICLAALWAAVNIVTVVVDSFVCMYVALLVGFSRLRCFVDSRSASEDPPFGLDLFTLILLTIIFRLCCKLA